VRHPRDPAFVAALLFCVFERSEINACASPGLIGAHACLYVLSGLQLDVGGNLFFQFRVHPAPHKQGAKAQP
jgi:hypothetical protein